MKIEYTYDEPGDKYIEVFESVEDFFETSHGKYFKDFLTNGRLEHTQKVVIYTDYPSVIIVEFKKEKKG